MELRQYVSILQKWLWLIVLGAVLAAGSAFVFSIFSTPVYQSAATLLISQGTSASGVTYTDILTSQNIAATYVEQIKSPVILIQVINDLNLPFTPQQLAGSTTVQQVRSTMLINVSVEDISPERTMATANQIAKDFIAWNAGIQSTRYQSAQKDLDQQLADLRKKIDDTQKALVPLGDPTDPKNATAPAFIQTQRVSLQMDLSTYQAQYSVLLKSAQDFRLASSQSVDSITITTPAQLPQSPVRPNTRLNTLLGLVVGLMLGVGVAFLIEYLDDTLKSSDDVNRVLGLPTLGAVVRVPSMGTDQGTLITVESPRAPYAEAYRNLRTNLQFALLNDTSPSSLVVSSAEPGEGKSTTIANLAVVMAQMGKKVILVDTDLRRPTLHRVFKLPPGPGLTDLLLDESPSIDPLLSDTLVPGLQVLVSGTPPPNPAELLASERMGKLVVALKQRADIVLFDSPPILPVTDAALLAAKTGNLLWVVGAGTTRTEHLRRAREALTQVDTKVLGIVLNRVTAGRGYGYYYYYYYDKDHQGKKRKLGSGAPERSASVAGLGLFRRKGKEVSPIDVQPESMQK